MQYFALLASVGLATALPTLFLRSEPEINFSNNSVVHTFSEQEAHANVMQNFPANDIITSKDLGQYASNHQSGIVYVSDKQVFLDVSTLPAESSHSKRQSQFPVTSYSIQNPSWQYSDWTPVSGCLYTGLDSDGATLAFSWTKTVEASLSAGLNFDNLATGLSASVGFSLTQSFAVSETATCNVAGNSVAQIWERNKMAHADVYSQTCWYFNGMLTTCDGEEYYGGMTAPCNPSDIPKPYDVGCSTGADKTSC
jgi:hypothetical protein